MLSINKKVLSNSLYILLFITLTLSLTSCELEDKPTPTHELMQGVWEIEEVIKIGKKVNAAGETVDEEDEDITKKVTSIFPGYMHLDDQQSINSTCGPLFMYLVYGDKRFVNVVSQIDEVFKYTDLQLTEGEWFIDKTKEVNDFTCEVKMKFPSANTLETILSDMGGVKLGFLDEILELVIYHKFNNIDVQIDESDPNSMIWTIDENVEAFYNTKNKNGDKVLWNGVGTNSFQHCSIRWKKRQGTLNQVIKDRNKN